MRPNSTEQFFRRKIESSKKRPIGLNDSLSVLILLSSRFLYKLINRHWSFFDLKIFVIYLGYSIFEQNRSYDLVLVLSM